MAKFLGPTGLTVLWSRIKAWVKRYAYITSSTSGGITTNTITIDSKSVIVPSKTSDLNNDAGFITGADIPEGAAASSATPLMDGTASAGTSNAFARGDHRHPSDTSKIDKIDTTGLAAGCIPVIDVATGNLISSGESISNILEDVVVNGVISNQGTVNNFATCSTAAASEAKTASVTQGTIVYAPGVQVVVKFENKNTASNVTLNVDNKGAKEVHINGTAINAELHAGVLNNYVLLEYDGTYWNVVGPATTSSIVWDGGGTVFDQNKSLSGCLTQLNSDMQTLTGRAIKTVAYDTTTHTITTTKVPTGSTAQNVVTAAQIVADGGGLTSSNVGQANGVASLDANGKVPSSQLPSYVDDVVEAYIVNGATALSSGWLATGSASGTAITPEAGKIYIIMNGNSTYPTNSEFRWGGSSYVQLYDGGCTEMTESEMNIAVMGSDTSVWT